MENVIRCQSCGMPLGDGFFGTEKDQSETQEFCKFCYQDGEYVQPDLQMEDMVQMSINNMVESEGMDLAQAESLANQFIPNLKRWKK
ncbi:MAG TPA: zinc ribbon domain-containing protein [Candidatus Levybacteria bacterium]|nr:zinc ribbon domain-containing protein [Candidatus Levybacteria bacterium]